MTRTARDSAQPRRRPPAWQLFAAVTVATLGWACAWVGIRHAVRYYEPGELALGRYLIAGLVLLPIWISGGAQRPSRRDLPGVLAMGLLGFSLYNILINSAERTITAGTAAFVAAVIPVLNTVGARLFFREQVPRSRWGGIALSFSGVGIIAMGAEGGLTLSRGTLLMVAASICAAGYSLILKHYVNRFRTLDVLTWAIWAGVLFLVPFGLKLPDAVTGAPLIATANVVFLGVVPGALSYACMAFAIAHLPMARAISFLYLVAPLSVALGWLLLDELPSTLALAGGGATLAGVLWTQNAKE